MKKTLDFNTIERPALELTLKDEAKTTINVGVPTEELFGKLTDFVPQIKEAFEQDSAATVQYVFDFAAQLMSCNREGLSITADDLRQKYGLKFDDLILFFSLYTDFVAEIANAKN